MLPKRTSFIAKGLVAAGILAVLALTLRPSEADSEMSIGFWCFFCGSGGVADGFLNVLLFMPLGAGLGFLGGPAWAVAGSLTLSGMVELIQSGLPGRFPSAEDLALNTLGGLAGWVVAARWSKLVMAPSLPSRGTRVAAMVAPLTVCLISVALSAPTFPSSTWYGQWTHELGAMDPYTGQVTSADLGGYPLPDGLLPDQAPVREALARGEELRVTFVTGPPPTDLTHLFAIYDDKPQEIALLGVQGSDLLFQRRTLSVQLRFDQPFMIWEGALKGPEGTQKTVKIRREGSSLCMALDEAVRCDLAPGVEGGWRLLHRFGEASTPLTSLLGWFWLALLSLPAGLVWARDGVSGGLRTVAIGVFFGFSGSLASWVAPWMAFHPVQLWAPICGALAGHWAGLTLRGQRSRAILTPPSPPSP